MCESAEKDEQQWKVENDSNDIGVGRLDEEKMRRLVRSEVIIGGYTTHVNTVEDMDVCKDAFTARIEV